MASKAGLILQAAGSVLVLVALIIFANSYVLVFPAIPHAHLVTALTLELAIVLVAFGTVAKNPQGGYKAARKSIVGFAWLFFLLSFLLLLVREYRSMSFLLPAEPYMAIGLLYMPYFALILVTGSFFSALLKKAPLKNKISGEAIITGTFMLLAFIPQLNRNLVYMDSLSTFVHEVFYISIPMIAVEAYYARFKFHRRIPAILLYGNMVMVPLYFQGSLKYFLSGLVHPATLVFPLAYLLLSYVLAIIASISIVYIFRGFSRPMSLKKLAGAVIPTVGGYFILLYFGLLPTSFIDGKIGFREFLSPRVYFIVLIAILILTFFVLAGRIIASKGGKSTIVFGTILAMGLISLYMAGDGGKFQVPLIAGMALSSVVVGTAGYISGSMKEKFLANYDLLKTVQVNRKPAARKQSVQVVQPTPKPKPQPRPAQHSGNSQNVPDFWIGREISGYRVTDIISRETGFAYVLKAVKPGEAEVAIKILKPFASDGTKIAFDNEFLRKFLLEFQNVMILNGKKYVVNIIGVGLRTYPEDGTKMEKYKENPPAIIMELLQGGKLSDLEIKFNTQKQIELFFEIVTRVAQGLQDAHDAKILHGDIKPDNIMFSSRNGLSVKSYARTPERLIQDMRKDVMVPKIVDFGSAKVRGFGNIVFSQFSVLYSPPEILLNNYNTDETYDVYEFGMVMYYMLTGSHNDFKSAKNLAKRQVFIESRVNSSKFYSDRNQLIRDASSVPVTEPSKVNPFVKKPLQYIIMRCIDPDPANRYSDMSEIRKSLLHCANHDYGFKSLHE